MLHRAVIRGQQPSLRSVGIQQLPDNGAILLLDRCPIIFAYGRERVSSMPCPRQYSIKRSLTNSVPLSTSNARRANGRPSAYTVESFDDQDCPVTLLMRQCDKCPQTAGVNRFGSGRAGTRRRINAEDHSISAAIQRIKQLLAVEFRPIQNTCQLRRDDANSWSLMRFPIFRSPRTLPTLTTFYRHVRSDGVASSIESAQEKHPKIRLASSCRTASWTSIKPRRIHERTHVAALRQPAMCRPPGATISAIC